jgi:hypothetical protein
VLFIRVIQGNKKIFLSLLKGKGLTRTSDAIRRA